MYAGVPITPPVSSSSWSASAGPTSEALAPFGISLIGPHELERDAAIEIRIVRAIHDAHAAFAQAIEHEVTPDARAAVHDLDARGRIAARRGRQLCSFRRRTHHVVAL